LVGRGHNLYLSLNIHDMGSFVCDPKKTFVQISTATTYHSRGQVSNVTLISN
jgi:hypothetical protein